jgi:tubulin-specific chaperone A
MPTAEAIFWLRDDEVLLLQSLGHSANFETVDTRAKKIISQVKLAARCNRELRSYEGEALQQQTRIDRMISDNADEHEVRKQRQVLSETVRMLPECQQRYDRAIQELKALIPN